MKAEDLMIGDIVTFKDCQNDEDPVVIRIWQINQDGEAFVFIDDEEATDEIVIDDEIVGLPLTTKIFEKNGFISRTLYEFSCYQFGKNSFSIAYDTLLKELRVFTKKIYNFNRINSTPNTSDLFIQIQYVHELQHALKLCGIDKEIVL